MLQMIQWQEIKCKDCFRYEQCLQEYKETNRKSLRNCQYAIEDSHYSDIKNMKVLEIGCGRKDKGGIIKRIVEANNCQWIGIDILETDLSTHVCSVVNMPFDDNTFDWAIGCQTIEHWDNPKKALKELARVVRPGGKLSLTAPIHLHGGKMFVRGDFDAIEKLFEKSLFKLELAQKWRKHFDLFGPFTSEYQIKHLKKAGVKNNEGISAYVIHCLLTNNKQNTKNFWGKFF